MNKSHLTVRKTDTTPIFRSGSISFCKMENCEQYDTGILRKKLSLDGTHILLCEGKFGTSSSIWRWGQGKAKCVYIWRRCIVRVTKDVRTWKNGYLLTLDIDLIL